jgi:5'-3' exonuclease
MGIPRYFRYIAKSFEGILYNAPNATLHPMHFYLDMNSIIHPVVQWCIETYPAYVTEQNRVESATDGRYHTDMNYHTRFEKAIYKELARRLDVLIGIVRPTKTLYLAIDGVAPRAKMEQQRIRRYKSGYERHRLEEIHRKYQSTPPPSWDRNAITPGTIFLYKLCKYLECTYLPTRRKESTVETILLDDANSPGEGEHKIFEWIRKHHPRADTDTNTEATETESGTDLHCIYGLDADLIMLSLCNPNSIVLLREAPEYYDSHESRERIADELSGTEYIYFNVDAYKDRIIENMMELISVSNESDESDIVPSSLTTLNPTTRSGLLYDYVWLCFLFGNDFLPHFFGFEIKAETVDKLIRMYVNQFKVMRRHFVDIQTGRMDMIAVKQWFDTLYANEMSFITDYVKHANYRKPRNGSNDTNSTPIQMEIERLRCHAYHLRSNTPAISNMERTFQQGSSAFNDIHDAYYRWYFGIESMDANRGFIQTICRNYLYGLQWNIEYYVTGCRDQEWYYPYRGAPCLRELSLEIAKNQPIPIPDVSVRSAYCPIQQLLFVLPSSSFGLLPSAIRTHLLKQMGYYGNYYPDTTELEHDVLFKVYLYECHPFIPYLPVAVIDEIIEKTKGGLNAFDTCRNQRTHVLKIE